MKSSPSLKRPAPSPEPHLRRQSNSKRRLLPATSRHHPEPPPPAKHAEGDTVFRVLCPTDKAGAVIGKGGAGIRQLRQSTTARIRIDESVPGADERVISVAADAADGAGAVASPSRRSAKVRESNREGKVDKNLILASPAQQALVMVFERIVRAGKDDDQNGRKTAVQGSVTCRLLVPSGQVGCVLGKGGKTVERIRHETGAQIRVDKEKLPLCAAAGDKLILITGRMSSVRKALLSVTKCLQENLKLDASNSLSPKPPGHMVRNGVNSTTQLDQLFHREYPSGNVSDRHQRNYSSTPGSGNLSVGYRKILEEEIVFRLLCSYDKVGSLIGRGGSIIRALQADTGASIKILDSVRGSEEQIVLISAIENSEMRHSPAQDAVMGVHTKVMEMTSDGGAVKLLVPAPQIGCLMGKGGSIIEEMRRATEAHIRIFQKNNIPRCALPNDQVVQVHGSLPSVQDALRLITRRLRESILPLKTPTRGSGAHSPMETDTPPKFRSKPSSPAPVHLQRSDSLDHHVAPRLSVDHIAAANNYHQANERNGYDPPHDRLSPNSRTSMANPCGNRRNGIAHSSSSLTAQNGGSVSLAGAVTNTSVDVTVPKQLLSFVYGDKGENLNQIRQMSGANVIIYDPKLGASEGNVLISGTPDQALTAQRLLHAFILCEQASP